MSCQFKAALIRPFRPSPDVSWAEKVPLQPTLTGYSDAAVDGEFRRFVNRDLASVVCGLVFGVGGAGYSALKVWHVTPLFRIINYVGGVIALAAAVLDVFFLMFGTLTPNRATARVVIAIVYAVICINVTSYGITGAFATCEDAEDYLGQLYERPAPTPERQLKYCAHVTNPYVAVCLGVAFSTIRLAPCVALTLSVIYVAAFYAGYALSDLPGESVRALVAKLGIYLACIGASLALNVTRYSSLRAQFEQSIAAFTEGERALKKQEEVETLLGAMVPESVLERMSAGEPVFDHSIFASVLYSDIVSFTHWSSSRTSLHVATMLQSLCVEFDRLAVVNNVEKIKTIGDAYWAVAGLPEPYYEHAKTLCGFAQAMILTVRRESARNSSWGSLRIRVGVDSGEVYGTVFGKDRLSYEVFGPACERAHLCEQHGNPMQVCIGAACLEAMGGVADAQPHTSIELPEDAIDGDTAAYAGPADNGGAIRKYPLLSLPTSFPALEAHQSTTESTNFARSASPRASLAGSMRSYGSAHSLHSVHSGIVSPQSMSRSMASPNGRTTRVRVTKDAKRHRDRFLAERMEKQQHMAEGEAASLEEIERRYSKRRHNWVLMRFDDDDVEDEYTAFVDVKHNAIRTTTRVGLAALAIAVVASFFVQGSAAVPTPASWTLLAVATVCACALPFVSHFHAVPSVVEAFGVHAVALTLIVGCGLASGTGTSLDADTVAGNDLTYMHAALTPLLTFGVAALPSAAVLMLNFVVVIVPIGAFVFESVTFTADVGFLLLSLFFAAFGAVISEKLLRQQFLEAHIVLHQQREQRARIREQQAVLSAILPPFIIPEVVEWLGTGFDPSKGIVRYVSPAIVAFMQLKPPPDRRRRSCRPTVVFPTAPGVPEQALERSALIPCADSSANPTTISEIGSSVRAASRRGSAAPFGEHADDGDARHAALGESHWLIRAHQRVDAVLQAEGSVLIKIKTIGDLVLLAGPFAYDGSYGKSTTDTPMGRAAESGNRLQLSAVAAIDNSVDDARVAADEALVIFAKCAAAMNGHIAGGMHAGSFVGTVLGTSRLCFDIFGDGVNTASRVMTSCAAQIDPSQRATGVAVSEPFLKLYAGLAVDTSPVKGASPESVRLRGSLSPGRSSGAAAPKLMVEAASPAQPVIDDEPALDDIDDGDAADLVSPSRKYRRRSTVVTPAAAEASRPMDQARVAFATMADLPPGPLVPEPGSRSLKRDALEHSLRAGIGAKSPPMPNPASPLLRLPAPAASANLSLTTEELAAELRDDAADAAPLRSEGTCFSQQYVLTAKGKGSLVTRVVTKFPDLDGASSPAFPAIEATPEGVVPAPSFHFGIPAADEDAAADNHHLAAPTRHASRRASLRRPSFVMARPRDPSSEDDEDVEATAV